MRRVWLWPLGAVPLALVVMVAGLALTGAAAPRELVDPGPLVRWGLPAVTALTRGAATVTVGAFMLCALVLPRPMGQTVGAPPGGTAWRRVAGIGAGAAVVWALAQLAHLILTHAAVLGAAIGGAGYGAQLAQFVTDIELGRNLAWATLLAATLAVLAVAVASYASAAWASVLALVALFPVAATGHTAGAASHDLAVSSWWLHLGGVTAWVGGLVALCLASARVGPSLPDAAERYSRIALWAFAVTVLGGTANAWVRLSSPLDLFVHPYGQLLLVKVILTVALGLAGWAHRTVTIPAIRAHAQAPGTAPGRAFWRLAGVEVLIMGAVVGVAVALGSSPPPETQAATTAGPVYALTGYPEPPLPTVLTYLTQWRPDPLTALGTVAGLVIYLSWVWRLRRRGRSWPAWRTVSWMLGLVLFFWVTNGGPAVYGDVLFSGHMIHHMLLVVLVPVFIVLAAPVTLALRVLPNREDGSRGSREWIDALVQSRLAVLLAYPVVAAVHLTGSVLAFYYSPLFEMAQTSRGWHVLAIGYFTTAGCFFANALIGVDLVRPRPAFRLRLASAMAMTAFYAVLGLALMTQTSLLAADYFGRLGLGWGVEALTNQQRGGLIVWSIGETLTFVLSIALIIGWARQPHRAADLECDGLLHHSAAHCEVPTPGQRRYGVMTTGNDRPRRLR